MERYECASDHMSSFRSCTASIVSKLMYGLAARPTSAKHVHKQSECSIVDWGGGAWRAG
jgi:hypothetical protein